MGGGGGGPGAEGGSAAPPPRTGGPHTLTVGVVAAPVREAAYGYQPDEQLSEG
jgi:hypothetical protein